jgi:hypothetical protein
MGKVSMAQNQRQNAIHKIDGYYLPRPGESHPKAFDRAKQQTIEQLRSDLENVEEIEADTLLNYKG